MKAAEIKVHGIKCDNPNCNYSDMSVEFKDYEDWIDRPCPKCGSNLLTKEDYYSIKFLMTTTESINNALGDIPDDSPKFNTKIDLNGTGKMKFGEPKIEGDRIPTKEELDKSLKDSLNKITPEDFGNLLKEIVKDIGNIK